MVRNSFIRLAQRATIMTSDYYSRRMSRMLNPKIYRTFASTPRDFDEEFYWLKHVDGNKFAFGIKESFIEEHGEPEIVVFDAELNDKLQKDEEFGTIENTKAVQVMPAPFDNCVLHEFDEEIDFEVVVQDPENIDNRICLFRLDDASEAVDAFAITSASEKYSMPLL